MAATPTRPQPPWKMPRPLFREVIWREADGSGEELTGFITRMHPEMIDVSIYPSGAVTPLVRTGVKHVGDPSLKTMTVRNSGGVFDLTEGEKLLLSLRSLLKEG